MRNMLKIVQKLAPAPPTGLYSPVAYLNQILNHKMAFIAKLITEIGKY